MRPQPSSDVRRISRFLADLKNSAWLRTARRCWPDYLFHYTDIENALSIVREGALFSRNEAQSRGLMSTDNASPNIIDNTNDEWKDYVRLYFRPKTPTQFRNEGFRPIENRYQNAHCPLPIYFVFDSKEILTLPGCRFSDGNLAAVNPNVFSTAADLENMPFKHIYHEDSIPKDARSQITFHKNAEVIVPTQLGLSALRYIVCRSQAEYETFLHLLPRNARARWRNNIRIDNHRTRLFFKRWAYVESVELDSSHIAFHFNKSPVHPSPFHAKVAVTATLSGKQFALEDQELAADNSLVFNLSAAAPLIDYFARLTLDGQIAYAGRYQSDDLPW